MLSYDNVTVYGNAKIDYMWITNVTETSDFITGVLNNYTYQPVWDGTTVLLASYTENINAGSVISLDETILSWVVYRRSIKDSVLTYIATIPAFQTEVVDYNVQIGQSYQYVIFAITENLISAPLVSEGYLEAAWDGWSIVDLSKSTDFAGNDIYYINSDNVWRFTTSLASNPLTQNLDKYEIDNFTQFPKVSSGKKNYYTGGITTYLSNMSNGVYSDNITMQTQFKKFVNNGNVKLLKDRKGNAMFVDTTTNEFQYKDESAEQITTVTFTFTQVDDGESFPAIGGM